MTLSLSSADEILYRGTVFEAEQLTHDGNRSITRFLLAEVHEPGFVFQIVGISGYSAGLIFGLIREDQTLKDRYNGITKSHLLEEIHRNILDVDQHTIKIFPNEIIDR